MSTSCTRCGAVAVVEEPASDFAGMCPGCLADFVFESPGELETLGKYRLLGLLGSGGMGVVYRAEHVELGKTVAVKVLRPHLTESEQERFRHEARTLARIRHPNIVPIHDFGTERGWFYFVMEYLSARPLSERLSLPRRDLVDLVRKVALAIQHLHEQGILHRDLKPANILVDDALEPHVVDFGLVKTADASLTPSNALLGTPSYMSPEQVRGEELDARSDVYALGAVLYECLAGRPPFEGGSPTEILQRVIRDDPVKPACAPALARICLKAMEKDRDRRYGSAAELAEDLRRFLEGEKILARGPGVRPGRFLKRRAPHLLAVLLLLAVGTSLYFALRPRPVVPPTRPSPRLEDLVAVVPHKEVRYMLAQGLLHYKKGEYWPAVGYFEKCAGYLKRVPGWDRELSSDQIAWCLQQAHVHIALCQWRLGHPGDALQEMRLAREAGFRDDGSLEDDEAFRALKADPRFPRE